MASKPKKAPVEAKAEDKKEAPKSITADMLFLEPQLPVTRKLAALVERQLNKKNKQ